MHAAGFFFFYKKAVHYNWTIHVYTSNDNPMNGIVERAFGLSVLYVFMMYCVFMCVRAGECV